MSKNTKKNEVAETKVAEAEVKVEKKPTEKQTMLADYKAMAAAHKAWRQKFNSNFPAIHASNRAYLEAVSKQIAAWDKELDGILAKASKEAAKKTDKVNA